MKMLINNRFVFLLSVLITLSFPVNAQSGFANVEGSFCSKESEKPVPGLKVSLVHTKLGRSTPAYTNNNGYFKLSKIPINNKPYYLEVYWGKELIYRSRVAVNGSVNLRKKCL